MVRSLEQISQNLAALDQRIETLGEKFYNTYASYLSSLGKAVRQHLILSCYQICTENYPKQFLKLSVQERQQLQQDLQELAQQLETDLIDTLRSVDDLEALQDKEIADEQPQSEQSTSAETSEETSAETSEETTVIAELLREEDLLALERGELLDSEEEDLLDDETDEIAALFLTHVALREDREPPAALSSVQKLAQWQEFLERSIVKTLQSHAKATNRLLQQAGVLMKFPPAMLEMMGKTEDREGQDTKATLMSLLVEASEKAADGEPLELPSKVLIKIVTVRLQLAEIEFNDPTVMSWRNQLRVLRQQFQSLGREYYQQQRDRAIAEAQLAWKSTWTHEI